MKIRSANLFIYSFKSYKRTVVHKFDRIFYLFLFLKLGEFSCNHNETLITKLFLL